MDSRKPRLIGSYALASGQKKSNYFIIVSLVVVKSEPKQPYH